MTSSYTFCESFGTESCCLFPKDFTSTAWTLWSESFRQSVPWLWVENEDDYPSCLWSHLINRSLDHDWYYMSLLPTTVQLLSTGSTLPLSSPRWLFSQFDSWSQLLFQLMTFRALELRVLNRLNNMTSHHCLQSGVVWWFVISNILLLIHNPYSVMLNRILQFWLVSTLQDHSLGYFTYFQ